jgi:hypothetical protein
MNIKRVIKCIASIVLTIVPAHAQGTFQNLNFEQAAPISAGDPSNPGAVTAISALPFWSVYYGNSQQTEVEYNEMATGSTRVALESATSPVFPEIDGNYSVLLQGGLSDFAASISQTGLIPTGSQSLLFEAEPGPGTLDISIGSQNISFTAVGTGANYTLYGANISAWDGDTETLTISALEGYGGGNNWEIDDISFSTNVVVSPEPNMIALAAIGGLLFGARKRFARR